VFQLYICKDRDLTQLIQRAKRAGYGRCVVTVDHPVAGNVSGKLRAGFAGIASRMAAKHIRGICAPSALGVEPLGMGRAGSRIRETERQTWAITVPSRTAHPPLLGKRFRDVAIAGRPAGIKV